MRHALIIAIALGVVGLAGCTSEIHQHVRFPDFLHPGWANQQRRAAIEHDPYPLNDVGPEVVGGRPREYQQPVPEVERARMYSSRTLSSRTIPASPWPTAPTTSYSPPSYSAPPANYAAPPPINASPPGAAWPTAPAYTPPSYGPPATPTSPYPSSQPQPPTFQQRQRSPY